jgi:hypothetical protein
MSDLFFTIKALAADRGALPGLTTPQSQRPITSLLTWRISTLYCCDVVADDRSWGRLCRRCGLWGRHGLRRDYGL